MRRAVEGAKFCEVSNLMSVISIFWRYWEGIGHTQIARPIECRCRVLLKDPWAKHWRGEDKGRDVADEDEKTLPLKAMKKKCRCQIVDMEKRTRRRRWRR